MSFARNFIAVGVAQSEGTASCVVLALDNGSVVSMAETAARKLADDLLRNANYLWGVEEETE